MRTNAFQSVSVSKFTNYISILLNSGCLARCSIVAGVGDVEDPDCAGEGDYARRS